MHRFRSGIAGIAGIVLAAALAGCGGSTVDEGPKPFTPTDTSNLNAKELQESMKKKAYAAKAVPPDEKKAEKKK